MKKPTCVPGALLVRASLLLGIVMMAGPRRVAAQTPAIDVQKARQYFAEAKALSDQDHGVLWKVQLCGPLLFVEPETRYAVANQADAERNLNPLDGIFAGNAPPELGFANTATKWAGIEWTMVMWPLPQYKQPRLRLVMHECFHRVQSQIGLEATDALNSHLDSLVGRIWLQMEWRALEHAFWQQGEERKRDVADAVFFRNYRRSFFPAAAAANENALEMNEGMAEYTGFKLSTFSPEEYAVAVAAWLGAAPTRTPSYGRSFAYSSGPAYGGLLDAVSKSWRTGLTPKTDLGQLLAQTYGVQVPAPDKAQAIGRAERYDGREVSAIETEREARHQARVAAARKLFVDGPVLALPVGPRFSYTFDPNAVLTLDDKLTLYEGQIQVSDGWGRLKTTEGVLFTRENGRILRVQVPAPADANERRLTGTGWTLELQPEWQAVPEGRPGDFAVRQESKP
jgi:hypothetical protein